MKKIFFILFTLLFSIFTLFAQSDDDLFGGSDDDLFGDDGIEEITDVKAKSDLSKGVLFENGSIKVGGSFTTGLSTQTILYDEEKDNLGDNIHNTTLTPDLSAYLTVDARPTQELRMYTKFGLKYPFAVTGTSNSNTTVVQNPAKPGTFIATTKTTTTITDWLTLKELFTDFSVADTAFFRFGLHTVTWGAGYFYSPVSDLINTSSIDPENTSAQVDGAVNLRTQIVFPNTQNCLWFYVVPSTKFTNTTTAESYARDTTLSGKADILLGTWELGVGGVWKYEASPKAMMTLTGSFKSWSVFGEAVYRYGADSEWNKKKEWDDKTSIFQATVGFSRYWKEPMINLAAQYYYDGNNVDKLMDYEIDYPTGKIKIVLPRVTSGHNVAVMASKGKLFGSKDLSLSLFGMANFGRDSYDDNTKKTLKNANMLGIMNQVTASATLRYSPNTHMSFGIGPYATWLNYESKPTVSLKLTGTLGGGQF